jgi:hypothetical protein
MGYGDKNSKFPLHFMLGRFLKSTIIQKTMHFRIDNNAFVRGYLILGE